MPRTELSLVLPHLELFREGEQIKAQTFLLSFTPAGDKPLLGPSCLWDYWEWDAHMPIVNGDLSQAHG